MAWPGDLPGAETFPGDALPTDDRVFNPPYIERPQQECGLRFKTRYGVSVYRVAGVWAQSETPDYATIVAVADRFYAGGHIHTVTAAQVTELVDAGYGSYIT